MRLNAQFAPKERFLVTQFCYYFILVTPEIYHDYVLAYREIQHMAVLGECGHN